MYWKVISWCPEVSHDPSGTPMVRHVVASCYTCEYHHQKADSESIHSDSLRGTGGNHMPDWIEYLDEFSSKNISSPTGSEWQ